MPPELFDGMPEENIVLRIDAGTLRKAEKRIRSCQYCNSEGAQIAFVAVLDGVTGVDPTVTDYILESPARCPNCQREILQLTLVASA